MTETCIHVANVLYLVSFLSRDILWLRVLTCFGLIFGVIFFTTCPTPLYGPTVWHVVFLVINIIQIYNLLQDRRETDLTPSMEIISETALDDFSRDELLNLLAHDLNGKVDKRRDFKLSCQKSLDDNELILKRLVLEKLSRKEIINVLSRRMHHPIRRRFKRKRSQERLLDQKFPKIATQNRISRELRAERITETKTATTSQ